MKLIFPNGEHKAFTLPEGITRIGSSGDCQISLGSPGIAIEHARIECRNGQTILHATTAGAPTLLNGHPVVQPADLKPGDLIQFGPVTSRTVTIEHAAPATSRKAPVADDGHTRVRAALPKFMLRGVSGATFGKTFALAGTMTVGRSHDCDISIPSEEVSRNHLRLKVVPDGVLVEDLNSANGTWVNEKRVQAAVLKPNEELRLDTIRFLLLSPSMEVRQPPPQAPATAKPFRLWIVAIIVAVGVLAACALHYLGEI